MTKFEEEVKRPANGPLTELNNNMQEVFSQYRKMRQYADYLEYDSKQKDEYILKLENENSFMRDERTTFDSNGMAVEPKLQQQAPPVVPEFVAEYIEGCKRYDCGLIWAIRPDRDANDNSEKVYDWLFPNGVKLPNGMYPNPYEPDNLVRPDKENQIKFVRAWLDGYTVEKPQLFYLKNKLTGDYLAMNRFSKKYSHHPTLPQSGDLYTIFPEQEIDSMQTGSYELVPVEDGE